jgi:membrane-associated phospholipid phosphatase
MTDSETRISSNGAAGGQADAGPAATPPAVNPPPVTPPAIQPDAAGEPPGTQPGSCPSRRAAPQEWAVAGAHRRVLAAVACLLLAMAAGFAAIVGESPAHPPLVGLDKGWGSLLRPTRDAALTDFAKFFSYLAGPLGGTIIAVAVAVFLWFARKRRVAAVFVAITPAVTSGASQLIKHLVARARPAGGLVPADVGSFPSGHVITTLAVGLALIMVLVRPGHRRWALAAVGAATLVMIWCRTYLGVHRISDTLESLFVAGGLVLALWVILGGRIGREAATLEAARTLDRRSRHDGSARQR